MRVIAKFGDPISAAEWEYSEAVDILLDLFTQSECLICIVKDGDHS